MKLSISLTKRPFQVLFFCLGCVAFQPGLLAQDATHEYAQLTRDRVEAALMPGADVSDLRLAEGSLTALGWFAIYGNGQSSVAQVRKFNDVPVALYNGTEKMSLIYMDFTSDAYAEMLNLGRFESRQPLILSAQLADYAKSQVEKAISMSGSEGDKDLIEAEGSLMALGWLAAYGDQQVERSNRLEDIAYKIANEVYSIHNRGYQIMRNYVYWKMDAAAPAMRFTDLGNNEVKDNTTGLIWLKNPAALKAASWGEALAKVAALQEGGHPAGTWRLPTNEEWKTMVPGGRNASGVKLFSVDWDTRFWSSSTPANENGAYHIGAWGDGGIDFDGRSTPRNLWPVRN
jgi:hypothetical protein